MKASNFAVGQEWVVLVCGEKVLAEIVDVEEGIIKTRITWSPDKTFKRSIDEKWDFHFTADSPDFIRQVHKPLSKSLVQTKGRKGTYVSKLGGTGLGYEVEGLIYNSGGNGFYYVQEVLSFTPDSGESYMRKVKGMGTSK